MSEEPSEEEVLEEEEEEPEVLLAEKRYDEIDEILSKTMKVDKKREWSINDMLDVVFLNKTLGIPVFIALMWAVFQLVFTFGAPFQDVITNLFDWIGTLAVEGLPQYPIVGSSQPEIKLLLKK